MFSELTGFSSKVGHGLKNLVGGSVGPHNGHVPQSEEDAQCLEQWGVTLAEEDVLVEQLQRELLLEATLGPGWDLNTLRRFLRARKHVIPRAKAMVLATLKWREDNRVDALPAEFEFPERAEFHRHYPEGFYCTDRDGRPVYVQQPGNIDCAALWTFTTMERSIKYHITQQEKYVARVAPAACIAAGGRDVWQSLVLIDMEGVGVGTLTGEVRGIMARVMKIDQDHYPELMHKALVINAPTTFRVIWAMIKYLLDPHTQHKIEVLPVDYRPELLKHIAPENLLEKYGGTNKTPLIEEPGPWKDPKILAEVVRREDALRQAAKGTAKKEAAP